MRLNLKTGAIAAIVLALAACGGMGSGGAGGSAGGAAGTIGAGGTTAGSTGAAGQAPAGTNGAAGSEGPAGSTGNAGAAGTSGAAGTTGAAGTNSAAGTGGALAGRGGGTGAAGASGTTGTAGTTGAGGRAGTTGAAGRGGTTGAAGAAGRGGSTGSAGTGGSVACGTPTTLKAATSCTGRMFGFGAALAASHLGESAYAMAAREHNFVTPENEMKWDQIEPTRGSFTYGPADQIVTFAMQNGMAIKGHTLVWHKQLPTWVTNLTTASEVRSVMVSHITNVMNHFKGKVTVWDVVNEAWLTDGRTGDGNPRLRDSVFFNTIGPSFIDEAFMAARQADPAALLVYNEFANEGLSDKSTAVYNMVRDMKMRGIPIDGVGLQMHVGYNTNPTAADLATNMQRIADLGLKVYISEMDVNGCAGYSADQTRAQYHDMVAACVAQPACLGFTVWGITDKYTWLDIANNPNSAAGCATGQLPAPLLWDGNYTKKSAYTGVMDALRGR